tara:strand:- start:32 stop:379 length:348 start_codon:yes stop_codon:yes gene_type:complete
MNISEQPIYANQGHNIPDFLCTGISRAYMEDNNLIIVIESKTGIESEEGNIINEVARLIVPSSQIEKLGTNIKEAIRYGISNNKSEEIKSTNENRSIPNHEKTPKEKPGKSLGIY